MIKICIITANRAEYGILKNLIIKLKKEKKFEIDIFVTGSHLDKKYGLTKNEIIKDKIKINKIINVFPKKDSIFEILKTISFSLLKFNNIIKSSKKYDFLLILGDRYELIAPSLSFFFMNIPIIHINGGDITEGSLDDKIRNLITSISSIHFVTNQNSEKRVKNILGYNKHIYNVGSLSYSRVINTKNLNKKYLEKEFKIKFSQYNCLVTFHPITNNKKQTSYQLNELLLALKEIINTTILFTFPNNDEGSNFIINRIKKFVKTNDNSYIVKSLGFENYINFCKKTDFVIGNSSSFVIEIPLLKIPSIVIGNRQKGRQMPNYVFPIEASKKRILDTIKNIISKKITYKSTKNIYVKANTENKIIKIIKKYYKENF